MKTFIVSFTVVVLFALYSWELASPMLKRIQADERQRTECIARLVSEGIERVDISTSSNKCWVSKNGYYIK